MEASFRILLFIVLILIAVVILLLLIVGWFGGTQNIVNNLIDWFNKALGISAK